MFHLSRKAKQNNQDGEYLIEARSVVKTFKTAAGPFTALKEVNLRVNRGEFVAVIGKSGSGKSTLLNMLTSIDRPTAGEIYVDDTPVHTLSEGQLAKWRGKHLGIVFQFFQLLPTLTWLENVILPMDLCGLYSVRERKKRAMGLLELVEMGDQAHKLPMAVSGGAARFMQCNLSDEASVAALIDQTQHIYGPIDLLVNNAARVPVASVAEMDAALWDSVMAVNC